MARQPSANSPSPKGLKSQRTEVPKDLSPKGLATRPWIKVKLALRPELQAALNEVENWRILRSVSLHLTRAILMYGALMRGNDSLLREYFPGYFMGANVPRQVEALPEPDVPRAVRLTQSASVVQVVDEEAALDDAAGKFLDMFG